MKKIFWFHFLLFIGINLCIGQTQQDKVLNISGIWNFQTDPGDIGVKKEWFKQTLPESIKLPGSMPENGKGDELTLQTKWTGSIYDSSWYFNPRMEKYRKPGNLKFPFWLTPDRYYVGAAWYQKIVDIPQNWVGKNLFLFIERAHWESLVWVDEKPIGMQNSLSIPHRYDLTTALTPGKHTITIRIDNRTKEIDPGPDSHSITDHTQGNWNGMVGRMELIAKNAVSIADVQVYPNIQTKNATVKIVLRNTNKKTTGKITLSAEATNTSVAHKVSPYISKFSAVKQDTIILEYPMGKDVQLWNEFSPVLYNLTITVTGKNKELDKKEVLFGMREIKVKGSRFYVNGQETFLRGTVENCEFPLTGYMPMEEDSWIRIFKICKSYGLNHMRFHSVCPPEAAFIAADKTGFYLQPEGPSWANHGTSLGDGRPIDKYIWDETERIINEYGNHASFTFFAYGNEPRGRYVQYLDKWVIYWKNKDSRRLYTGASTGASWQIIPQSEYLVRARPRGLNWKDQADFVFDYRNNLENQTIPYVTHEMGQWCVFPNFNEIPKYTGHLKAKNFELFREDLADKNMADKGNDFLMASGKLQALCYKAEIEAALRTPGLAGFQLLSLNDYPGQGTALVGLLDAFWDDKGYINASEFSHFCNTIVPLARIPKFTYKNTETFITDLEIANFGSKTIKNGQGSWKITNNTGTILSNGKIIVDSIPLGNCIKMGTAEMNLATVTIAEKLILEVTVEGYSNSWEFWVYPSNLPSIDTTAVYTCNTLDSKAKEILKTGGKVLVLAAGKVENGKDVVQQFTPVFWNTSWFKMRPPHTTGILVEEKHPVFTNFPTEYYSNYQWFELVNRQQVMNLDSFPANFKALVQPIDTWFLNRKLGLLFEANVEKGKVIVCSADLTSKPEKRVVARQLLYSIRQYMNSDKFNPQYKVELPILSDLFEKKDRSGYNSYTKDSPDELKPNYKKPVK
jgi:hypothetical protein